MEHPIGKKNFSLNFHSLYNVWHYLVSVRLFKNVHVTPEIGYVTCDMDCHNKYSYFIEQFGNQYLKSANLVDNHVLIPQSGSNFHSFPPKEWAIFQFPNCMHIFYALVPETLFQLDLLLQCITQRLTFKHEGENTQEKHLILHNLHSSYFLYTF